MKIMNGYDMQSETRVYDAVEPKTKEGFHEDLRATAGWRRFALDFGATAENLAHVPPIMRTLGYDPDLCSVAQFEDALITGMDSGRFKRKPAAPPAPVVPVDKNGKKLSQAQIQWGEFLRFSESASTSERKERQRTDPAYGKFVESQWRKQMDQPIDGDVREFNPHLSPTEDPSEAKLGYIAAKAKLTTAKLIEWVAIYNSTPSAKVRSLRSAASNPLGYEAYELAFQAAIEANLI